VDQDWSADRESRRALIDLVYGRGVELFYAGRHNDRYGRILAHAFVGSGGDRIWVQERLIAEGQARAYTLPGETNCLARLLSAENSARQSRKGLWAGGAYQPLPANPPRDLLRRLGEFALVEGTVTGVNERGQRLYLNFGQNWKRDFTITVPPAVTRAQPEAMKLLKALSGARVRVRGWIERRNGPAIEISDPLEIEKL
jgi:hypothetical protein